MVYIHLFSDGNGRIARFWVSLILIDYNTVFEFIPFEEEIYLKQDNYYESISKCHNNGNVNEFIDFMLKTILDCIRKTTQKLKDNGIIERIGADNGGYWKINEVL